MIFAVIHCIFAAMKARIKHNVVVYKGNTFVGCKDPADLSSPSNDMQHHHNDYQLLIINAPIKCLIGNLIKIFEAGDILVLGMNIPHQIQLIDVDNAQSAIGRIAIVHFRKELLPKNIEEIGEYRFISFLLKHSPYGVMFRNKKLFKKISSIMEIIKKANGIHKINQLMLMLDTLGRSKSYKLIMWEYFGIDKVLDSRSDPMQRTFDYIYLHFVEGVKLVDIARYANYNASALCRLFKKVTGLTIFQFLNKVRIDNACKLLMRPELTISQAAYDSGFNSLAHFNKQFKLITTMSPTEYREKKVK